MGIWKNLRDKIAHRKIGAESSDPYEYLFTAKPPDLELETLERAQKAARTAGVSEED